MELTGFRKGGILGDRWAYLAQLDAVCSDDGFSAVSIYCLLFSAKVICFRKMTR